MPDPEAKIDLYLYSSYWLEPDVALSLVRKHAPHAFQQALPTPDEAVLAQATIDDPLFDASAPVILDGYSLLVPLGEINEAAGIIEVRVSEADWVPPIIAKHRHGCRSDRVPRALDGYGVPALPTESRLDISAECATRSPASSTRSEQNCSSAVTASDSTRTGSSSRAANCASERRRGTAPDWGRGRRLRPSGNRFQPRLPRGPCSRVGECPEFEQNSGDDSEGEKRVHHDCREQPQYWEKLSLSVKK